VRETVCAPLERLMVSVPVRVPVRTGVKVTVTMQLWLAGTEVQVVVAAKSPVAVTLERVIVVVPAFTMVTVWLALVVPTAAVPRFRLVGDTVIADAPVPVRETVCLPVARVMVRAPVLVPEAVGLKVTETVQDLPAAIDEPQVVESEKSPLKVMPLIAMEDELLLETVTV